MPSDRSKPERLSAYPQQQNYYYPSQSQGYYQQPGYSGYCGPQPYQQSASTLPPATAPGYEPGYGPGYNTAAPIEIRNPSSVTIKYRLNGTDYSMSPGQTQRFSADRAWVIEFDRGTGGAARYSLTGGNLYRFTTASQGRELKRWELASAVPAVADPVVPMPAP